MAYLDLLSQDNFIPYRKELNKLTGSVTATILLSQIIRRWEQNNSKPFYKFRAPCGHRLYKEGDSWVEELGFTERELDTALAILCRKEGKTRKDIKEDSAKKKENCIGYVTAHTNIERVTYYTLNANLLEKDLSIIYGKLDNLQNVDYEKPKKGITKPTKERLDLKETNNTTDSTTVNKEREHSPEEKDIIIYPLKEKKLEEVAGGAGGGELLSNSEQLQAPQTYEELKAELWRKSETGTKLATYLRNLELPLLNEKSKIVFEKVFDKWLAYQISEKSKLNICNGTIESAISLVHSEHKKKVSIAGLLNNWTCTTWSKQEAQKYMTELNKPAGTRKTALEELQECDFENLPAY